MSEEQESLNVWQAAYVTGLIAVSAFSLVSMVAVLCTVDVAAGTYRKITKKRGS